MATDSKRSSATAARRCSSTLHTRRGRVNAPAHGFTPHHELDHARLFDLVAASPGPALFTYDDAPEVRQMALVRGFTVDEVTMRSAKHVEMRELTIRKAGRRTP